MVIWPRLVELFSLALNSTKEAHAAANEILKENIDKIRSNNE